MEKLNIAEILKDCPSGMELDCTMFEGLEFDGIVDNSPLSIRCRILNPDGNGYNIYNFTKYGCWNTVESAKCVIFPKGKTTWEGFQRPFKDGDVLISKSGNPFIFKRLNDRSRCYSYCGIDVFGQFQLESDDWTFANSLRFATEEEKEKFFKAIKDNGYKWNAKTKTLEKLIEPKFKVWDRIKEKRSGVIGEVIDVQGNKYNVKVDDNKGFYVWFHEQDNYELLPNKFDITTLKPFDKVLVRCGNNAWHIQFFEKYDKRLNYPFVCMCYNKYRQCIPYDGNEHLLGTTNDCDEYYKTWE